MLQKPPDIAPNSVQDQSEIDEKAVEMMFGSKIYIETIILEVPSKSHPRAKQKL